MRYLAGFMLLVLGGCSGCSDSTTSRSGTLDLALRTGSTCAEGCSLERGLLPGTEERIEIRAAADVDLGALRVASEAPDVLAAWLEPTRLCCAGATCAPLHVGARCEGGQVEDVGRMLAVRAFAPGTARVTFALGDVPLDSVDLQVVAVSDIVAERALVDIGSRSGDVILHPPFELPPLLASELALERLRELGAPAPSIRGSLDSLALRVGTDAFLRLETHDAEGRTLHGREGVTVSVADPSVALLVPPGLRGGGGLASYSAELVQVRAMSRGVTELVLRAGNAEKRIAVEVSPSCAPEPDIAMSDAACESDADCVPDACCHAASCTHASAAPACEGVACTLDCQFGTLDCGGRCLCLAGRCAAHRSSPPNPECPTPWEPTRPPLPTPDLPTVELPSDRPTLPPPSDDDPLAPAPGVGLRPVGPRLPPGPMPTPD